MECQITLPNHTLREKYCRNLSNIYLGTNSGCRDTAAESLKGGRRQESVPPLVTLILAAGEGWASYLMHGEGRMAERDRGNSHQHYREHSFLLLWREKR